MTSFRSAAEQAKHLVMKKTKHGQSRRRLQGSEQNSIVSISTETKYRGDLKRFINWLQSRHLCINAITPAIAVAFLEEHQEKWTQSTVDGYRQTLRLVFNLDIDYIKSKKLTILLPRAYKTDQLTMMCASASKNLRLSISIALNAGLRAHELDTLALPDEMQEDNRPWLPQRFAGRDNDVRYVVHGKGGLRRSVLLTPELADELDKMRLSAPKVKREREVNYVKRYSVIGGQSFSQQFSRLSNDVLGWSTGGHGLRHRFAQDRLRALQFQGFNFTTAVMILSQELGHFSMANTLTYLR